MPELQRVRGEHGPAILAFETENRAYFASSITDRGDEYFECFDQRHEELLARQETGVDIYHVLVDGDGAVIGRFNLMDIGDGSAELGYRVGQRVAGQGVATATVQELCRLAASQMGLHTLRARTRWDATFSWVVLARRVCRPIWDAASIPCGPRRPTRTWRPSGSWPRPGSWPPGRPTSQADPASGTRAA